MKAFRKFSEYNTGGWGRRAKEPAYKIEEIQITSTVTVKPRKRGRPRKQSKKIDPVNYTIE